MSEQREDKNDEAKKLYLALKARRKGKNINVNYHLNYYWNDEWNGED